MHLPRFVRVVVPFVMLGLVACVLGCSENTGGMGSTPPDKETEKLIREDMKNAQKERMKAMRGQMKGGGP